MDDELEDSMDDELEDSMADELDDSALDAEITEDEEVSVLLLLISELELDVPLLEDGDADEEMDDKLDEVDVAEQDDG